MKINLFNIFTFLKENKLYAEARAKIADLLQAKKEELRGLVEGYLKEKTPELKEKMLAFIMNHIELKFPYNLFKGSIKKVIGKNFDKLVEFILVKLQEI